MTLRSRGVPVASLTIARARAAWAGRAAMIQVKEGTTTLWGPLRIHRPSSRPPRGRWVTSGEGGQLSRHCLRQTDIQLEGDRRLAEHRRPVFEARARTID